MNWISNTASRGRNRQASRGVTLIEVLIAVTLLSLLVAGVLLAMRVGLDALQKTNSRFLANRRALGAQRILEQQLAGFVVTAADCIASGGPQPTAKINFFQGEPQTMRFVSQFSLAGASRGFPQILEFQVIPGEEGRGVRLIVNEHLYTGPLSTGRFCYGLAPDPETGTSLARFTPVVTGPGSFVLADQLAFCRFLYKETLPDPPFERWLPRWVATYLPAAIRVEMQPLALDPAKIGLTSFVSPVFVRSRVPLGVYSD
ncbi:MAG: prepilin-type N-terminal cleavage/methylation domain-containing protein [Bryobacteraceae bacterium]|nr:prepilin-type N-terminal cleavage/methylation domain-containing protein [Bryobacteraceae bacterium]MDW8378900.1 prepilin-type N-terminal cleavage/methylation domain-containing protein [Bryobacterales bacterium]